MLEGPINWNGVNLNMWPRDYSSGGYFNRTLSVDGLYDFTVSEEWHPVPGKNEERPGDTLFQGKLMVFTGFTRGKDLTTMRTGLRAIWEACYDRAPHQLGFKLWDAPGPLYVVMRVSQPFKPVESQDTMHFQRSWTVGLRAEGDPRFRLQDDDTVWPTFQTLT